MLFKSGISMSFRRWESRDSGKLMPSASLRQWHMELGFAEVRLGPSFLALGIGSGKGTCTVRLGQQRAWAALSISGQQDESTGGRNGEVLR